MTYTGEATVGGAITVVNAIPAGRGAAIGIDLHTTARVELDEGPGDVEVMIADEPDEDPGLVRACIREVSNHVGVELHGRVETQSTIPIARGLKSSSACANAVVLAAYAALDRAPDRDTVLSIGISAARRAGVTHTGALDDASASLLGGLTVTDNVDGRILEHRTVDGQWNVLILAPERRTYTRDAVAALDPAAPACAIAHERALDGDWQGALTLNGLAVAAALGEPLGPTAAAVDAGAAACGITGTGPAVAAVCTGERVDDVIEAWRPRAGQLIHAHTSNNGWRSAA